MFAGIFINVSDQKQKAHDIIVNVNFSYAPSVSEQRNNETNLDRNKYLRHVYSENFPNND